MSAKSISRSYSWSPGVTSAVGSVCLWTITSTTNTKGLKGLEGQGWTDEGWEGCCIAHTHEYLACNPAHCIMSPDWVFSDWTTNRTCTCTYV